MGEGGTYRLEIKGRLGDLVGHSFPRMRILYKNGNTVLIGPVRDQGELTSLLQRITELGLALISVTAVGEGPAN
jgi:hypothetical protein